jgi:hypothetical protein
MEGLALLSGRHNTSIAMLKKTQWSYMGYGIHYSAYKQLLQLTVTNHNPAQLRWYRLGIRATYLAKNSGLVL